MKNLIRTGILLSVFVLTAWATPRLLPASIESSPLPSLPVMESARQTPHEILWIETNGISYDNHSGGDYSRVVNVLAAHPQVNLTIKKTGSITPAKLAPFDLVFVPSLANYDFPWTTAEYDAFEGFVQNGGCLYIWTDNPITSHVATDPLMARFGLSRDGTNPLGFTWQVTIPGHIGKAVEGVSGGGLLGGTTWLTAQRGESMGVYTRFGGGGVYVLGDGGPYQNHNWTKANNAAMLKVIAVECRRG